MRIHAIRYTVPDFVCTEFRSLVRTSDINILFDVSRSKGESMTPYGPVGVACLMRSESNNRLSTDTGARVGVVVKALRYKPAGRGFDSRCCHWNFSVT